MGAAASTAWNVVDSSGWLEYLADSPAGAAFAPALTDTARLIVPVVTIYEVVKVVKRVYTEDAARRVIQTMRRGRVVDMTLEIALAAASNGLPLADSVIYATAQELDAILWTQGTHFEGRPGVKYFPKDVQ
jgi:toxin FitB